MRALTTHLSSLLKTCTAYKSLTQAKVLHQKVITFGLQNNLTLHKNLLNLYLSCKSYDSANFVFQANKHSFNTSLWNFLISAYTNSCMYIEAVEVFKELVKNKNNPCLRPDSYTYPSVLKAFGGLGKVEFGSIIHSQLVKNGLVVDLVVASSLVGFYGKCSDVACAVKVFDEMRVRDVASWNSVLSCYYQDGQAEKVLEVFDRMKGAGFEPSSVTITTVIASCARLLDLKRGEEIHEELVRNGFPFDGFVSSALVDFYAKCGCLEKAKPMFEGIPRKNVVAWNAMIAGCSAKGDNDSCIELFRRMIEEGIMPSLTNLSCLLMAASKSANLQLGKFIHGYVLRNNIEADTFVKSSLIDLYFKCGLGGMAENLFTKIQNPNIVLWNVMISGYVSIGSYFEALSVYDKMKEAGVAANAITFTSVLSACSQLASLEKGKEINNDIIARELKNNGIVMGALIDMYAKCGAVDEAFHLFNQLPERDLKSWTSMISAYGSHGQALKALKLFHNMKQSSIEPDRITFLAVLSACSHGGLVDEGLRHFDQMIMEYGIKPGLEHYACLLDLLGRAGRLHEAYGILKRSPEANESFELLSTLFSACCFHRDLELGEEIANVISENAPGDPSTYIALSNMYASVKKWDEACQARSKMKELGLKKNPGCSWIEVEKRIQPFFVNDNSHILDALLSECLAILDTHITKDIFLYHEMESEG